MAHVGLSENQEEEAPQAQTPEELGAEESGIGEHLDALRGNLIKALVVPLLLLAVIWPLWSSTIHPFLSNLLLTSSQHAKLARGSVLDSFSVSMKGSIYLALFLSIPWIMLQIWRFISPGLYENERRFGGFVFPFSLGLFVAGVGFAFFVVIPTALGVLLDFGSEEIPHQWLFIDKFYDFVFSMLFVNGFSFQIPLVIAPAVRFGLLPRAKLTKHRRGLVFASVVLGAVLTPTGDPITMLLVALPLYGLVEGGAWLGDFWRRRSEERAKHEKGSSLRHFGEQGILDDQRVEDFAKSMKESARSFASGLVEGARELKELPQKALSSEEKVGQEQEKDQEKNSEEKMEAVQAAKQDPEPQSEATQEQAKAEDAKPLQKAQRSRAQSEKPSDAQGIKDKEELKNKEELKEKEDPAKVLAEEIRKVLLSPRAPGYEKTVFSPDSFGDLVQGDQPQNLPRPGLPAELRKRIDAQVHYSLERRLEEIIIYLRQRLLKNKEIDPDDEQNDEQK